MANQDPINLNELARQIRLNRQEGRQSLLDERSQETRGLQNKLLTGKVQEQTGRLSDLAAGRQLQVDLQTEIRNNPDADPDRVALDFYKRRDPKKAQEFGNMIFSRVGDIAKVNPKQAIEILNRKTGLDVKLLPPDPEKPNLLKIDTGGEVILYDPKTKETVETFTKTVRPGSGETITVGPDGTTITRGTVQQQKFDVQQKEKDIKQTKKEGLEDLKTGIIKDKVTEALDQVGPLTAGFLGSLINQIPGTPARDLEATIKTLQANLGFTALQQMRDASPTGGALGQVSERELALLTSTVANLGTDQSPQSLRRNLNQIMTSIENWESIVNESKQSETGQSVNAVKVDEGGKRPEVKEFNFDAQGNLIQ